MAAGSNDLLCRSVEHLGIRVFGWHSKVFIGGGVRGGLVLLKSTISSFVLANVQLLVVQYI